MKYTLAAILLIGSLTTCTQEEVSVENPKPSTGEQVLLSAGIVSSIEAETETKATSVATSKTLPFTNRTFRLMIKDNRTTEPATIQDQTVKTGDPIAGNSNPAVVPLNPKLYWDDLGGVNGDLSFTGVYPSTVSGTGDVAFKVGTQTSTMERKDNTNANDLMLAYCANYTFEKRTAAANLPFEHKMAKVTLNLIAGVTGKDKFDLSTIKSVVLNQFPNEVTVNIGTGVVTSNTTKANITPFLEENTTTPTATKIYTAIVAPGSGTSGAQIATITTTPGHTYNVTVSKDYTLIAGKNNIFNITLNKSDVAVSATIKSWDENEIKIAETVQLVKVTVGAITDTKITAGSTLELKIVDAAAPAKTHSVTFEATNKTESGAAALYWVQNGSKLYWDDITFPSNGGGLNVDGVLKIKSADTKLVEQEYLYAGTTNITKAIITGTGEGIGTISFTKMEHPLCKLNITITTPETGTDKVDLTKMASIVLPKYPYSNYNMNAVPVSGTTSGNITVEKITDPASDPYKYTVYIFPQTIKAGSSLIDVTVTNEALSNVYQLKRTDDQVFDANTIYGITMTLKKTEIASNGKVTLVDWTTQGTISGDGTITE